MAQSHFDQFLREATYEDHESDSTLNGDALYGLYTSWCYVSQAARQPEHMFWDAVERRIGSGHNLRMKGPAAADYIVASYQAVV